MISLFQYIRILAAFQVLLIHQHFLLLTPFLNSLNSCAVPLFACMAGYLYTGGNKIKRIFIPYCIWAIIYFVANNVILDVCVRRHEVVIPPPKIWLLGGTACHLWFLPSLFIAFLIASLPYIIGKSFASRVRLLWGAVLLMFATSCRFLSTHGLFDAFYEYVQIYFGQLLFYFAIGFVLRSLILANILRNSIVEVIVGGLCVIVGIIAKIAVSFSSGLYGAGILSLTGMVFFVVGIVMLSICCGDFQVPKVVDHLAKNTMGIYLVHVLFTSAANLLLARCGFGQLPILLGIPLALALFLASYFCALLLPKWMKG